INIALLCREPQRSRTPYPRMAAIDRYLWLSAQAQNCWVEVRELEVTPLSRLFDLNFAQVIPAILLSPGNCQSNCGHARARVEQGDSQAVFIGLQYSRNRHRVLVNRVARQPLTNIRLERYNRVTDGQG